MSVMPFRNLNIDRLPRFVFEMLVVPDVTERREKEERKTL